MDVEKGKMYVENHGGRGIGFVDLHYELSSQKENSEGLKKCLENPHVRKILELLEQSSHPDALIQEYMQEPIFTEFVDECLKVVNPPEDLSCK